MIQRCNNPRVHNFKDYGGRGIRVCDRWLKFENFIADMGLRPSPRHSLDRKRNDLGYSPENCRWATPEEQQGNTRANRVISFKGRKMILSDWAREVGIPLSTLWRRLLVWKWTPKRALTEPVREKKPALVAMVRAAGYESVSDFLRRNKGFSTSTLYKIANGAPMRQQTRERLSALLGVSL